MDPIMDAAIGFTQATTMAKVQYAVAAKVLKMEQFQGDSALKLLQSADTGVAKAGDAMVAAATGLGGEVDVYA